MRRGRSPILARSLAFAIVLLCTQIASAIEDVADRVRVDRFENGLVVLTLEDRTTPVVSFQMWVRVGSRDESRFTGLAHLFEHMMFKGSTNIGSEQHAKLIDSRGGRLNAYTNRDVTVYFEDVTSESLPLVIDLEHERVANLEISERTLTSERQVVLEERRMRYEDSPDGTAYQTLFSLAFEAHPYRWPVIGWHSDVAAATVGACRAFFDAYYVPNNIVIVIVGDFAADSAIAQLRRTFGRLPAASSIPRNPTQEPEQRGERRSVVNFDVRSPILLAGWHAPASGHPDGEALDVLGQILSAGRSSRLYRSLVYDAQQALGAAGGYMEFHDAGLFLAHVSVRPEVSIDDVEALLFAEIERIQHEFVTADELEKAKRQLEVHLVNGLATNHALASRIGRDYVVFGRVRPLEERLERIRAVTAEDVRRVAETYLIESKRTVVKLLPSPAGPTEESP